MIAICPSQDQLKSLSLGLLPTDRSDELFAHVHGCENCQSELGTLDSTDDTFVEQMKMAAGESLDEYGSERESRVATARALAALAKTEEDASTVSERVPKTIGEYEIVRLLGRGGMGHVFLGRHTKLGRPVAIKFIAHHGRWDKTMQHRFASEMKTIGSLNHPNIVAAYDAREVDGLAVLVTEFIDGMDVSEIVKRNGCLSVADSCAIMHSVCNVLQYIDSKGLVHRDIKPSNIMIDQTGTVKVLDLGLARLQSENGAGEITVTGQAIGTADYVAPEQIEDGRNLDIRTDIYALGCTFYKLLCGRVPFAGPEYATSYAKLNAHVSEVPESIGNLRGELPVELVNLVDRMLSKKPGERPNTAAEVADQIAALAADANLAGLVESARAQNPTTRTLPAADAILTARKPQVQGLFWNRNAWLTAAALVIVATLFGIWLGITIAIKKPDGTTTRIVIPDGSTAIVDKDGNVDIQLGGGVGELHIPNDRVKATEPPVGSGAVDSGFGSVSERMPPGGAIVYSTEFTKDSPLFGKLEEGDLVDLVAIPIVVDSQLAIQNSWPKLLTSRSPVIGVAKTAQNETRGLQIELSDAIANDIQSAKSAGYRIEAVFHDPKRVLAADFSRLQGVWQAATIRERGITRTNPADTFFCFDRNQLFVVYGTEGERYKFELGEHAVSRAATDSESSDTRLITCVDRDTKLFGKSAIYRFLPSGKLEVGFLLPAPNSGKDPEIPESIQTADPVLRLQRVAEPRTGNAKRAFQLLNSARFEKKFEMRIATTQQVADFGEKQTKYVIQHSLPTDLLEPAADPNATKPVKPADQVVWLGPAFVTNRDLIAAFPQKGPAGKWGIRFDLTPLAGQKMELMSTRYQGEFLAVLIDGQVVMAPRIQETVGDVGALWLDYTEQQATAAAKEILPKRGDSAEKANLD